MYEPEDKRKGDKTEQSVGWLKGCDVEFVILFRFWGDGEEAIEALVAYPPTLYSLFPNAL